MITLHEEYFRLKTNEIELSHLINLLSDYNGSIHFGDGKWEIRIKDLNYILYPFDGLPDSSQYRSIFNYLCKGIERE